MQRLLTIALLALCITGCTTHGRIGALPTLPSPPDAAEIVVIREWRFTSGAVNFFVGLNGVNLYGLATSEHVIIKVPPGDHILGVSVGQVGNETTVALHAEARQRYYFRIEPGSVSAFRQSPRIEPISAEAGQALMAKTSQVQ